MKRITKHGFTLAEILIVLTIIGVMAVMTIPSLIQNSNSQQKIALFKKAFNAVSNAYATEFAVKSAPKSWGEGGDAELGWSANGPNVGSTRFFNAFANQLNVKYYYYRGTEKRKVYTKPTENFGDYWIVTEDGIGYLIGTMSLSKECPSKLELSAQKISTQNLITSNFVGMSIQIDVDGPTNGPNVNCSDDIDLTNLSKCDTIHVFQTTEGISAGNPDCTIAGRIMSDNITYDATKCQEASP